MMVRAARRGLAQLLLLCLGLCSIAGCGPGIGRTDVPLPVDCSKASIPSILPAAEPDLDGSSFGDPTEVGGCEWHDPDDENAVLDLTSPSLIFTAKVQADAQQAFEDVMREQEQQVADTNAQLEGQETTDDNPLVGMDVLEVGSWRGVQSELQYQGLRSVTFSMGRALETQAVGCQYSSPADEAASVEDVAKACDQVLEELTK